MQSTGESLADHITKFFSDPSKFSVRKWTVLERGEVPVANVRRYPIGMDIDPCMPYDASSRQASESKSVVCQAVVNETNIAIGICESCLLPLDMTGKTVAESIEYVKGIFGVDGLKMIVSPETAIAISETEEIYQYAKENGFPEDPNWGLPEKYMDVQLIVEETVKVGRTPGEVATGRTFAKSDDTAFIVGNSAIKIIHDKDSYSVPGAHLYANYRLAIDHSRAVQIVGNMPKRKK